MNKTKIALLVMLGLGSFATQSFATDATTSQQVSDMVKVTQPAPLTPEESRALTEKKLAEADAEANKDEKVEIKFVNPEERIDGIRQEVANSARSTTLDKEQQAQAFLLNEKAITDIMKERFAQRSVVDQENDLIAKQHKKELDLLEKVQQVEEKKEKEEVEQQQLLAPPMITDNVSVLSVYGTNNNLFAEIKVNNNKYQVQKGQNFGDGYKVSDVNRDGVKIVKQDVEQFINVSANPTLISTPQAVVEPVNQPNVIVPYQLK